MSFLIAAPELMADAAANLANLGSAIGSANFAAAAATTGLLPAAADEVSTQIASMFSAHAAGYQQLSAQAAAFHEQFVQALTAGAGTYASAEANIVQTLAGAAQPSVSTSAAGWPGSRPARGSTDSALHSTPHCPAGWAVASGLGGALTGGLSGQDSPCPAV